MSLSFGIGLRLGQPLARESTYAVETRRVLARWSALGVPANADRAALLDAYVRALKDGGAWAALAANWLFAAHAEAAARVNLISPGTLDVVPSGASVPAFTADRGYTGNGTTGYLDTGIDPSSFGGLISQNAVSVGVRSLTAGAADAFDVATGDNIWMRIRSAAGQFSGRIGDDGSPQLAVANTDGIGHFVLVRSGASSRASYKNGAAAASDTEASTAPASSPITFLRRSGTYSTRQIASGFVGGALTADQVAVIAAADLAYAQAVGAAA